MVLSSGLSLFKEPIDFSKKLNEFLLSVDEEFLKGKKTEEVFDTGILLAFQVICCL